MENETTRADVIQQRADQAPAFCKSLGVKIKSISVLDELLTVYMQDASTVTVNLGNPEHQNKLTHIFNKIENAILNGKRTRKDPPTEGENNTTPIKKLQVHEVASEGDLFTYQAEFVDNHDGDTVTLNIDLGFSSIMQQQVTLNGINAPELTGDTKEAGEAAKKWLHEKLNTAKNIIISTHQKPKGEYNRYSANITTDGINLNAAMVTAGHAKLVD